MGLPADLLMAKLKAALPLPAMAPPPMLAQLQEQAPALDLSPRCQITQIHYAGDEGGILCNSILVRRTLTRISHIGGVHRGSEAGRNAGKRCCPRKLVKSREVIRSGL